jgi:DNA-binding LytR/AlgR family response regulator
MTDRNLTAVAVDDEPLALAHLCSVLDELRVEILARGESALNVIDLCESLHPDVLFLDIEMPGANGMQLAKGLAALERKPKLVFVTGYTEYAVNAFDLQALDYLLKPVSSERLALTLQRVRESVAVETPGQLGIKPKRLPLRRKASVQLVQVDRIAYVETRAGRVIVSTEEGEQPAHYTLSQIESYLPKQRFMRIHTSCIVDVDRIEELLYYGNKTYGVRLEGGAELPLSRAVYPVLACRLGLKDSSGG